MSINFLTRIDGALGGDLAVLRCLREEQTVMFYGLARGSFCMESCFNRNTKANEHITADSTLTQKHCI